MADEYAAEYAALDAEALAACLALAPQFAGEAVALGDLDDLCLALRRPVRDARERQQLMAQLDPTNAMRVDRAAFTAWLLDELFRERQLHVASAEPATPAWEQIVDADGASFFYHTRSGESAWETNAFVAALGRHLEEAAEARALRAALDADGFMAVETRELRDELEALFKRFDDDRSGALDASEFRDLCVAVGFLLGPDASVLLATMEAVDASGGGASVSWEALLRIWTTHAPFQRRTRLATPWELWEKVERLDARAVAPWFRHGTTQAERWSHPATEQRVVDLLIKLFPSAKLDWTQRIEMLYDLQLQASKTPGEETKRQGLERPEWTLKECRQVLGLLGHECARREHVVSAVDTLQARYGGERTSGEGVRLSAETVGRWMLHCVARVEMDGWEECVDEATGTRYFYHETLGMTQWDPPNLENRMAKMMARFSGESGSTDDKIKRIFRHYDEDESGSISLSEFKRLYVALLGRKEALSGESDADDAQIRQVFSVLDTSGDDEVSLDEFMVWWKTKMNIEDEETEEQKRRRLESERRRIATEFLHHHNALIIKEAPSDREEDEAAVPVVFFESNMLPRLVTVLGKYSLKGLAYRDALSALVKPSKVVDQEVALDDFLAWYADFEASEKEKEELAAQKARAAALLQAQEAEAKEKARKLKMIRKGQLLTKAIASDAAVAGAPEPAEVVWKRHVQTLFRKFDKDSSGFLDALELKELTRALGHALNDAQIKQMMMVMDSSGDERVSVDEFVTFWTAFQRRKRAADTNPTTSHRMHKTKTDDEPHRHEAISMVDASVNLAVNMELAKERALNMTLADVKDALGDWKEALVDRARKKKEVKLLAEQNRKRLEELKKEWAAFVPTKKRRYAHLDVTWIEPEVVRCVSDMVRLISARTRPLQRQDAAQRIQRIMRGVVTRMRLFAMVQQRFQAHVDLETSFFFYVDSGDSGRVWLHRPLFRTITSPVSPWDLSDCRDKIERFHFVKRQREMEAKKSFYEKYCIVNDMPAAQWKLEHRLYVPASFVMVGVIEKVRQRLLGSLWQALRERRFVLAELIARRHWRQLTQRSNSDPALPLPLHHVVKYHREFPFRLAKAVYEGNPDAVRERDAYGRTPLHLALRERASFEVVALLLSQRHRLIDPETRSSTRTSVWQMQSVSGETPLHVALRYGISLELLRWIGRHESFLQVRNNVVHIRNQRGENVFHLVLSTLFDGRLKGAYWRSVVLVLFKTWSAGMLCAFANGAGDLPLHIAIERFADVLNQRAMHSQSMDHASVDAEKDSWLWLLRILVSKYPQALLIRRKHDSLMAIHLLLRARLIPESFVLETLTKTVSLARETVLSTPLRGDDELISRLLLRETNTTLLHYALLHRGTSATLLETVLGSMPSACRVKMLPQEELPLHLAARHGAPVGVVERMCELYGAACQTRNKKRELPLHLAVTSAAATEQAVRALLRYCPFVLSDPLERRGLRSLVMAANVPAPNAGVLRTLLDATPTQKLAANAHKRQVTPLFAIAARKCDATVVAGGILSELEAKFEEIEDEEAYFEAMAKARHRRQHRCPTAAWTFEKILDLMERNPVDEAVIQRSLLAINEKLREIQLQTGHVARDHEDVQDVVVETVTLSPKWMLVQRLHQTLFELPWNARVQLLGQAALAKLLPTAFAKAAYRARLDPYFNL